MRQKTDEGKTDSLGDDELRFIYEMSGHENLRMAETKT